MAVLRDCRGLASNKGRETNKEEINKQTNKGVKNPEKMLFQKNWYRRCKKRIIANFY